MVNEWLLFKGKPEVEGKVKFKTFDGGIVFKGKLVGGLLLKGEVDSELVFKGEEERELQLKGELDRSLSLEGESEFSLGLCCMLFSDLSRVFTTSKSLL